MFRMPCELSLYLARSGSGPQERVQYMYQEVGVTRELVRVGLVYIGALACMHNSHSNGLCNRVIPGQQKVSKKCPLLTAKHFQTQLTKKVREI
jgi:hypothetical protein